MSRLALLLAITTIAALPLTSCKQGAGEPCQVDSDCEDGLICRKVGRVCATDDDQVADDAGVDATPPDAQLVPYDAAPPDASVPPDAEVPDALPDAAL